MTRVGIIVECGRDGADHKVLRHLVPRIRGDIDAEFRFLGSKRNLFAGAPELAQALLEDSQCALVIIAWDLMPCDLLDAQGKPSCINECAALRLALQREGVDLARVKLLCISHELEAWLLTDGAAIKAMIERPTHPIKRLGDDRDPEAHPNPKKLLQKLFKEHRGRDYLDSRNALEIVERITNLNKLRAAQSFARLEAVLNALPR